MLLSDIQPQYFPRQHYFARMLASDIFVLRDEVQFVKNHKYPDGTRGVSYQAHAPIKTQQGVSLLAVNVKKPGMTPIYATQIAYETKWQKKHINVLKANYGKSVNAKQLLPELEHILEQPYPSLADLNIASISWSLGHILNLGDTPFPSLERINDALVQSPSIRLNKIELGHEIDRLKQLSHVPATERIVELCKNFGATAYLGGGTAFNAYMNVQLFKDNDIQLQIQDWSSKPYSQQFEANTGFLSNLSILDLLMNQAQAGWLPYLLGIL